MAGRELDASLVQFFAEQCWLDAHARLLEAGADRERGIWLPDVFVDLDAKKCRSFASAVESDGEQRFDEFDRSSPHDEQPIVTGIVGALIGKRTKLPSRLVLLGGPGSGKSTITQMVDLALRAKTLPRDRIEKQRAERLDPVLDRATQWAAKATRDIVPMRVVLPRLARFVHEQPDGTMGDFFAHESKRIAQRCEVSAKSIERFVQESPRVLWLFDGLDEVPATAGRAATIATAMRWVRNEDALVVTTRPQAYASEFDSLAAFIVQPLDDQRAKQLGRTLVPLWSVDPEQKRERTETFTNALKEPPVKALANSPLQTLLLAITIGSSGDLPRLRAALYRSLFSVLFRRETQKPNAVLRNDDEGDVLALHRRVGIALQVRGARSNGTTASISAWELRRSIVEMLREKGEPDERANARADGLMEFATNRLVLLERSSDREFSFAVRSMQEYFAADALIEHEDPLIVSKRIAALAPHAYWRNTACFVASIAAGMERKNERPTSVAATIGACERANASDALGVQARLDEWLAWQFLEELGEDAARWVQEDLWSRATAYRLASIDKLWSRTEEVLWNGSASVRQRVEDNLVRRLELEPGYWVPIIEAETAVEHGMSDRLLDAVRRSIEQTKQYRWPLFINRLVAEAWGSTQHRPAFLALSVLPASRQIAGEPVYGCQVEYRVTTIASFREACADIDPAALSGDLAPFVAACIAFSKQPSAETLSHAMRQASEASPAVLGLTPYCLPWPIDACVRWADRREDFDVLAERAASGRLGDDQYFVETDRRLDADNDPPIAIDVDMGDRGPPKVGMIPLAGHPEAYDISDELPSTLPLRRDTAEYLSVGPNLGSFSIPLSWIAQLPVPHARTSAVMLALDALRVPTTPEEHALFVDFCDQFGRRREHWSRFYSRDMGNRLDQRAQSLAAALVADPSREGLWNALFVLAKRGCPLPYERLSTLPVPIGPNSLDHRALAVFAGWRPLGDDEPRVVVDALIAMLGAARDWSPRYEELLAEVRPRTKRPSQEDALAAATRATMNRRPNPVFGTPERWTAHQLPGPFPHVRGPRPPVILRSIDAIENVRVFAKSPTFDRSLTRGGPSAGQWIVIIGENGSGKTTFLRALAFALATPAASTQLVAGHPSFIRNGGDGIVGVTLEETPLRVRLRRNENGTLTFADEIEPHTTRPWVVGYGVQRGAASDPDRKVLDTETGALGSLFDMPYALTNAKSFLSRCDHNALSEERKLGNNHGPKSRLWTELRAAMQRLLGVHSIEVDDGVWVRVREGAPRVSFETLSHGYLSMAGWVSDMVARWLDRIEKTDDEYPENIFATMTGVALVDEIDLHLHPRWQLTVIDELRALFPRMTFVATTHNPLTLHGAKPGEIFVLTKNEHGEPTFLQRDIRPGSDVDRVLFDVFGVHQTFDKRTREMLDEHRAMVARGVAYDDEKRVALERALRDRLGAIGDLISEQRGGSEVVVNDEMRALAEKRAQERREQREAEQKAKELADSTTKPVPGGKGKSTRKKGR